MSVKDLFDIDWDLYNHNMRTNFSCASARAFDLTETPTDEERDSK